MEFSVKTWMNSPTYRAYNPTQIDLIYLNMWDQYYPNYSTCEKLNCKESCEKIIASSNTINSQSNLPLPAVVQEENELGLIENEDIFTILKFKNTWILV